MNVLTTGASGFAGRHLVDHLAARGEKKVILLYNTKSLHSLPHGFRAIHVDLLRLREICKVLEHNPIKEAYHLAASVKGNGQPGEAFRIVQNNTLASLNLFEALRRTSPNARILNVGSSYVYENRSREPINERAALGPETEYGFSKLLQENIARYYAGRYRLKIIYARTFYYAGPGQPDGFLFPNLRQKLLQLRGQRSRRLEIMNPDDSLDYTDIRDVVRAYYLLMKCGAVGEVYNVCSGKTISIRRITKEMLKHSARPVTTAEKQTRQPRRYLGSCVKLRKRTGWLPKIKISETIEDMFEEATAHTAKR